VASNVCQALLSGKLGLGKDGNMADTFTGPWFYAQTLNILGGALYVQAGGVIENKNSTAFDSPPYTPRVSMSIHSVGQ